ncbi:MAG: hypothetical protein J6M93_05635 [Succinivibrio sp.]|nr:hypothetical protein [Succinivibrio sp.]
MKEITVQEQHIVRCLSDAGCTNEFCHSCADFYLEGRLHKMLAKMKQERNRMRNNLEKAQTALDTIDFLIREIEKKTSEL